MSVSKEIIECPHCREEKEINLEVYSDCGDICYDYERVHKCENCEKLFTVEFTIKSISSKEVSEQDLREYKEENPL